jgi:hypothetical protein
MSFQPRDIKPDKPAPRSFARPIFAPSSDIGSAYCWICPYTGEVQVRCARQPSARRDGHHDRPPDLAREVRDDRLADA